MFDNELKHKFKFPLGIKVKSKITGFSGLLTSRSEHLNGCDRYWVEPPVDKDGRLREGCWMDDLELEKVGDEPPIETQEKKRGGFTSKIK